VCTWSAAVNVSISVAQPRTRRAPFSRAPCTSMLVLCSPANMMLALVLMVCGCALIGGLLFLVVLGRPSWARSVPNGRPVSANGVLPTISSGRPST